MKNLVLLLEASLECYRELADQLHDHQMALPTWGLSDIRRAISAMDQQLARAREADAALAAALSKNRTKLNDLPLWHQRTALMQRADDGCHLLLKQIKAMMACLKADMSTLRQSKKAVSSYGGGKRHRGGLVSNAC